MPFMAQTYLQPLCVPWFCSLAAHCNVQEHCTLGTSSSQGWPIHMLCGAVSVQVTITSDSAKLISKLQRKEARKERSKKGQGVCALWHLPVSYPEA
jgi:hypothetical protein